LGAPLQPITPGCVVLAFGPARERRVSFLKLKRYWNMHRFLAAAATATLLATGAVAQTADTATTETPAMTAQDMHGNVTAMRELVDNELSRMGIAAETDDLTLRQLTELALVLDDDSLSDDDRIDQARQIIEN
jgi:hypothetical protein